ncbi:MAG: alpha-glucosidase, partial [Proteobacteria bacterium]
YQIYPRSFADSNGDGIGDLRGIIDKLDHLQYLGVNVVWISPFFKSPQDDNGYDISDYEAIQPEYGTMADFDELLMKMHRRGMKLLIDLVVNHTSDEHPWFEESRASKDSPKRDWYIWRDGKDGNEPNNWESIFGGSAWELDEKTAQYFLHLFSRKQPDLNWDNLEMRSAIYAMIRWWLDKGVDGFRIDAISHAKKEPGLKDMPNPQGLRYVPSYDKHMNVPGIREYIDDMCEQTFARYDIMTVGEANGVKAEEGDQWVGDSPKKFNMLFQFEHLDLWTSEPGARMDLPKVKEVLTRWQKAMEKNGWNALYLENHDIPRITSKWGDTENHWRDSATSLATMYFLMQGTPFIYQGQEIGMTNTQFHGPEDFDDVRARNTFLEKRAAGIPDAEIIANLSPVSRDNARTPMQWDRSPNGGFTRGNPWLKTNPNYPSLNVQAQMGDPNSVLEFYRKLIKLRRSNLLWVYGTYDLIEAEHAQVYAYTRTLGREKGAVLCNVTDRPAKVKGLKAKRPLLGNLELPRLSGDEREISLRPYEALVLEL